MKAATKRRGFYHVCKAYKDSGGMAYLLTSMVIMVVYLQINAKILQWLSLALDNPYISTYVDMVIYGCIINCILVTAMTYLSSLSIHKTFTLMNDCLAEKVIKADYSLFVKKSCSDIITTSERLWKCVSVMTYIRGSFVNFMKLLINIIMIGTIKPDLVLPIVVITALVGFATSQLFKWWGKLDSDMDLVKRSRNKEIDEVINGFTEVRGFCTENGHIESLKHKNISILKIIFRRNLVTCIVNFVSEGGSGILTVLVLLYSIAKILRGELTSSTGLILVMYMWRMEDPIINLINALDSISENSAPLPKIAELFDYQNEIKDGPIELEYINSIISFDNVSFHYDKSSTILKNISFDIKKGEKIGICGPTGGGKSTLLKLIPRFYDVCDGVIKIDGIDIKDMTLKSLRSHLGIVSQDPYIFEDTIYNNIMYGTSNCTENDVIEACKKASIYDFIQSLPDKFNTNVGPKGLKLSGGQKQRIALARIFLSDPDVILLDEATSALDNETESIIQESLEMFKDKTMIVVAHRLTTIKNSDKIIVINNHEIVEEGTHDDLIKKEGLYFKMYK